MIRTGSWVKCLPSTTEGSAKTSPHNAGLHARRMTTPAAEMYRRIDEAVIDMVKSFGFSERRDRFPTRRSTKSSFGPLIPSPKSSGLTRATSATPCGRVCFACSSPPSFARSASRTRCGR